MLLFHWLINVSAAATFCRSVQTLRNPATTLIQIILSPQQVVENQTSLNIVRLVATTKFCCSHKDFRKNSPAHTKRFVAATGVA